MIPSTSSHSQLLNFVYIPNILWRECIIHPELALQLWTQSPDTFFSIGLAGKHPHLLLWHELTTSANTRMEQTRDNIIIEVSYTIEPQGRAARRVTVRAAGRSFRDRRREESKDELIFEYGCLASMFVGHRGNITIPALMYTLKPLERDEIYKMVQCLEEDHLRPLLCELLGITLDTGSSVEQLCDQIKQKAKR
jgi:hypothetical protein